MNEERHFGQFDNEAENVKGKPSAATPSR